MAFTKIEVDHPHEIWASPQRRFLGTLRIGATSYGVSRSWEPGAKPLVTLISGAGTRFRLRPDGEYKFGRDHGLIDYRSLRNDGRVSRNHCGLAITPDGGLIVRDLGSMNHTWFEPEIGVRCAPVTAVAQRPIIDERAGAYPELAEMGDKEPIRVTKDQWLKSALDEPLRLRLANTNAVFTKETNSKVRLSTDTGSIMLSSGKHAIGNQGIAGQLLKLDKYVSRTHLDVKVTEKGKLEFCDRSTNGTYTAADLEVVKSSAKVSRIRTAPAYVDALQRAISTNGAVAFGDDAIATGTQQGTAHSTNEDAQIVLATPHGTLVAVFDGVGGMAGGREASNLARDTLAEMVAGWQEETSANEFLAGVIPELKKVLDAKFGGAKQWDEYGADTTATFVHIDRAGGPMRTVRSVNTGDSPAYAVLPNKKVLQLTHEDSWANRDITTGGDHLRVNGIDRGAIVTSTLRNPSGRWQDAKVLSLPKGSTVVVASDGIFGDFSGDEPHGGIVGAAKQLRDHASTPAELVRRLIDGSRKNDDRTAVVCELDATMRWPEQNFPQVSSLVEFIPAGIDNSRLN